VLVPVTQQSIVLIYFSPGRIDQRKSLCRIPLPHQRFCSDQSGLHDETSLINVLEGRSNAVGEFKRGSERADAKELLARGTVDLAHLDEAVEALATKILYTMPNCTSKTVQSVRKHKLEHWDRNRETNRAWLALNMMTEANAGFRAFNEAVGRDREVDFVALRRKLADGATWGPELIESLMPAARAQEDPVT